jgi:hypothetical protein
MRSCANPGEAKAQQAAMRAKRNAMGFETRKGRAERPFHVLR